jgi:hypothetical protein
MNNAEMGQNMSQGTLSRCFFEVLACTGAL